MTVRTPKPTPARRAGFTLVEMLTVIVIIGILASLTIGGAIAVRKFVRRGIIISDMKQIEMALLKYKSEVGELPPDFANIAADSGGSPAPEDTAAAQAARSRVVRHLRKAFPKMRLTGATDDLKFAAFLTVLAPHGIAPADLNPSTALTFWLGGIPDADGKPRGFSKDPTNPFKVGEPRSVPYFDFNTERLNGLQYLQPKVQPLSPYVYFRAVKDVSTGQFEYGAVRTDRTGTVRFNPYSFPDLVVAPTSENVCVPYLEDALPNPPITLAAKRVWRDPEGYQILAAGLDGVFSTNTPVTATPPPNPNDFRYSKIGEYFSDGDYDNLASFAEGDLNSEL